MYAVDNKPRIQLRVLDKIEDQSTITQDIIAFDISEKKKGKRGRPRKIVIENEIKPQESQISKQLQPKKRGRKKKQEGLYSLNNELCKGQSTFPSSLITKNYIVQLKVKSSDLEKIQKQFINKSQQIGYKPLISQKPDPLSNSNSCAEINEKQKNNNFDDYYKLLNNLEMPLVAINEQKINMICGNQEKQFPNIPNIYQNIIIPVRPENIPIHLFDDIKLDSDEFDNNGKSISGYKQNEDIYRGLRNTTNLVLPQFNINGEKWPETSPYPCWNCDDYFNGTPIGNVDKEVCGKFYCCGNFCDFPCAARHLVDHENTTDFWNSYSLLCIIYQKAYGLPPNTKVPIAPPRESLMKFGGKYSYEEYHKLGKLNKIIEIYKLPLVPVLLHIEEISKSTNINNIIQKNTLKQSQNKPTQGTKKISRFIPIDPQKLIKAEENLKQKAQERLQSNYTLDDCFGNK